MLLAEIKNKARDYKVLVSGAGSVDVYHLLIKMTKSVLDLELLHCLQENMFA